MTLRGMALSILPVIGLWSMAETAAAQAAPTEKTRATESAPGETKMDFVTGFGGFFFRSEDPEAIAQWYYDNLGITLPPKAYDDAVWRQEAGPTVFHAFPKTTKMFGDPEKQFMLNFRVRDLDVLAAYLESNGVAVDVDPQIYPNGRFALIHDPEGNPIQLWEPAGDAAQ